MKAVLLAVLVLTACDVGEVPVGGVTAPDAAITNNTNDNGDGEQSFDAMISPLVAQHRCLTCHGTAQSPNLTSFELLGAAYKQKPGADNILVTKADATGGQHEGITYFDAGEQTTIATWIDSL